MRFVRLYPFKAVSVVSNQNYSLSAFVRTIPPIMFYNMIRRRIKERPYQAWAASYIWWQYNFKELNNYCALTQLAHVSIDYFCLSTKKLDQELARVGLLQLPPYKDDSDKVAQNWRQQKKGRISPSLQFCLDQRAVQFIENDNLIWIDLMQQLYGWQEELKKRA